MMSGVLQPESLVLICHQVRLTSVVGLVQLDVRV